MSDGPHRKRAAIARPARHRKGDGCLSDDPGERRSHPRHVTLEFRAWLGWRVDETDLCKIGVRLVDVSRGGACVEAAETVPGDRLILLMLMGLEMTQGSVWTRVVSIRRKRPGTMVLHLAFTEPCPEMFFQVARDGLRQGVRTGA